MNRHVMFDVLNLKENDKGYYVASVNVVRSDKVKSANDLSKENFEMDKVKLIYDCDMNFTESFFTEDIIQDLSMAGLKLIALYKEYVRKDLLTNFEEDIKTNRSITIPLLTIDVKADSEGVSSGVHVNYVGVTIPDKYKDMEDSVLNDIENINNRITINIENTINELSEELDEKQLKKFEVVFTKDDRTHEYRYNLSCVTLDRPISQQKGELRQLLAHGLEERLLKKAKEIQPNINEYYCAKNFIFFANDKDIVDLEIRDYSNDVKLS